MNKNALLILASAVLVTISTNAFAVGMGFFGTLEAGGGDWKVEYADGPTIYDDDGDAGRLGFGFVLDTAVAQDRLFNYRLDAGLIFLNIELDDANSSEAELAGLVFDNTFGFGVLRNEKVRLWVGPRVRLGFYSGDTSDFSTGSDDDVTAIELGIGAAFGANFHVGPTVSLGLETGFMISGYGAEIESASLGDLDVTGDSLGLFLNGVVLFRLSGD